MHACTQTALRTQAHGHRACAWGLVRSARRTGIHILANGKMTHFTDSGDMCMSNLLLPFSPPPSLPLLPSSFLLRLFVYPPSPFSLLLRYAKNLGEYIGSFCCGDRHGCGVSFCLSSLVPFPPSPPSSPSSPPSSFLSFPSFPPLINSKRKVMFFM